MDTGLGGQVVAILGAAGGIGRAMAEGFAAESCSLSLIDRQPSVLELATELQRRYAVPCTANVVDAADYAELARAATSSEAAVGGCRHVVVTVGVGSGQFGMPFWRLDPTTWLPVVHTNLMACVYAAHAFVPQVLRQGSGSFCFLSSVAGQIGSPTDPPYSAAKAAVLNFMQCAARDLAPYQVRANAICPGMVKTELNQSVWRAWLSTVPEHERLEYEAWADQKLRRVAPLARWQQPEEIAAAAVFLASRWGQNMTGQTINVDGGQVMHS